MQTREQIEAAYAEGRITLEQAARMLFELGRGLSVTSRSARGNGWQRRRCDLPRGRSPAS